MTYLGIPLGYRARDADGVAFLEGIRADQRHGHLSTDAHHRDGIAQCIEQAGRGVAHSRTGGDQHHTRFAAAARITFGGMHGGLFMPDEHVAQPPLGEQRIVDRQHRASRIAEDDFDAKGNQRVNEGARAGFGRVCGPVCGVHGRW